MYSAEYRFELLAAYWSAFDGLRRSNVTSTPVMQGEGLHALHDIRQHSFMPTDVAGMNWKGLYDRGRQPKDNGLIHAIRLRYERLAKEGLVAVDV